MVDRGRVLLPLSRPPVYSGDAMEDDFSDPLFAIPEFRYAEFGGVEGRTVTGTAIRYGDVARTLTGKEQFQPGAFGDVAALDSILHWQHERARPLARTGGGGLVLTDSPEALEIAAELPETADGDDALTLIDKKILRGFSLEFHSLRERYAGDTRIIERAALPGVGLVDKPSYPMSTILEVRADGDGLRGEFRYDADSIVSDTGKVRKERIKPGAFTYALEQPDREISLVLGGHDKPLASKQAGSLILKDTPTALRFEVKRLPKTSYAGDFLSLLRAGSIAPGVIALFSRTPKTINPNADYEEEEKGNPGVFRRVINSGVLSALAILMRPPRGNPGVLQSIFGRRPKRPMRVSPFVRPRGAGGEEFIRPKQGDIVRAGRVIRKGQDVGPALRQVWI